MKVLIDINEDIKELTVQVSCNKLTPEIERLLASLRMMDMKLSVAKDSETYLLDIENVLYIESIDRKTFVYTKEETYESDLRLYEMEERLEELSFIRISKGSLVNLKKIKSLRTDINRKLRLTLINGEQIEVSRMYAEQLRQKLGVK